MTNLETSLRGIVACDPEQEVRCIAIPVLDGALGMVKGALGDSPVVNAVGSIVSTEMTPQAETSYWGR